MKALVTFLFLRVTSGSSLLHELNEIRKSEDICQDINGFEFENNAGNPKKCSWIDDGESDTVTSRRSNYCSQSNVKENCKRACGECCGDNEAHVFEYIDANGGTKPRTCDWLSTSPAGRKINVCPLRKGACPVACDACPTPHPTKAPTESPTSAPVKSPTATPSLSPSPTPSCHDNPGFRLTINAKTGRKEPCSWIDDPLQDIDEVNFRRKEQCRKQAVKKNCKRACGDCCGDNDSRSFNYKNTETDVIKVVTCAWLAGSNESKKNKICPLKEASCPEACGVCPKESTPTPPPTIESSLKGCFDEPKFRLLINAKTGREEPCSWIDDPLQDIDQVKFRRKAQCRKQAVKENCKRACGECCGDNDSGSFKYTNTETNERKDVTCAWLAGSNESKKERMCPLKKVSCPKACGVCPKESAPTPSPNTAIEPLPLTGCYDIPDFRLLINAETRRVEPCSWIDDGHTIDDVKFRRDEQCFKSDIKVACKRACGECCGDNTSHTFKYTNNETGEEKDVNCEWLAKSPEKRRKRLCLLKKGSCPEACGECARTKAIPSGPTVNSGDDEIPVMGGADAVIGINQAKILQVSLIYPLTIALAILWC